MAFDPPLGSTSPAVLLDNATRFDKLVNGPAATVPDRAGQPLDTWRQIVTMMLAAVTDAQNSITAIGLPFNTLSDAQAAVAAGKIPDGSVTWVRTTDSAALADEYKNINGVLTATGRRMPSQDAVDALSRQLLDSIVTGDVPGFWLALKDSA
ncbi:SGNH/GDSL hydrolase family protein, partial [Klebsiella pneumoniae]